MFVYRKIIMLNDKKNDENISRFCVLFLFHKISLKMQFVSEDVALFYFNICLCDFVMFPFINIMQHCLILK